MNYMKMFQQTVNKKAREFAGNSKGIQKGMKKLVGGILGVVLAFTLISVVFQEGSGVTNLIDLGNLSLGGTTVDFSSFTTIAVLMVIFGAILWVLNYTLDLV